VLIFSHTPPAGAVGLGGPEGHHVTGWNRLFVVIAVCWALVAPFLLMADANSPVHQTYSWCADTAYKVYGSSSSPQLDNARYDAERKKCSDIFIRDVVILPKLLTAMAGQGERQLGLVAWGFLVIPLVLFWLVAWGLGRIAIWVGAGFRR
jgi:hypothetical protein